MSRAFTYLRVSTVGQTTDNQRTAIHAAGFQVAPQRMITETVSGSVATDQRKGFVRLLDRLERDDVLVVTKLDRLERHPIRLGHTRRSLRRRDSCGIRLA